MCTLSFPSGQFAQIVGFGAEHMGAAQPGFFGQIVNIDPPRNRQKDIGTLSDRQGAQGIDLQFEAFGRQCPAARQQCCRQRSAAAGLRVIIAMGDSIHHHIARRAGVDAGALQ